MKMEIDQLEDLPEYTELCADVKGIKETLTTHDQLHAAHGERLTALEKKVQHPMEKSVAERGDETDRQMQGRSEEMDSGDDYYDVMILYNEDDQEEALEYCKHLNELEVENSRKVTAVLYDGPELSSGPQSILQHLEYAFKRCTFTFLYLTKTFCENDWCQLYSESCLIKSINDRSGRVVLVRTVDPGKADFEIPMVLDSLRGVKFYKNDDFYTEGLKKLIGGKFPVRDEKVKKQFEQRSSSYQTIDKPSQCDYTPESPYTPSPTFQEEDQMSFMLSKMENTDITGPQVSGTHTSNSVLYGSTMQNMHIANESAQQKECGEKLDDDKFPSLMSERHQDISTERTGKSAKETKTKE